MPAPSVGSAALELYARLAPLVSDDATYGWAALILCGAIGDSWLQQVDDLARDSDDHVGWSTLLDVNVCPGYALPWLGQFVGVAAPSKQATETEAQWETRVRALIGARVGYQRGTPAAMQAVAIQTLTGSQTLFFAERAGDAYTLNVSTRTSETPDPAATLAALVSQKPAGIRLNHILVAGQTWRVARDTWTTWRNVRDHFLTWRDVRNNTSH